MATSGSRNQCIRSRLVPARWRYLCVVCVGPAQIDAAGVLRDGAVALENDRMNTLASSLRLF